MFLAFHVTAVADTAVVVADVVAGTVAVAEEGEATEARNVNAG